MKRRADKRSHRKQRGLRAALAAVGAVLLIFLGYSYVETYRVEIKEYTVVSEDLPAAFAGTRIAVVADVHRSGFFRQGRVEKIVDSVNALAPDLIVLAGDYVYGSTRYEAPCFRALGRLQAPLGVYAALGNHDYGTYDSSGRDLEPIYSAVEPTNIVLLRNQGLWLERNGARLRLGAVGDLREDHPDLGPVLQETTAEDFVVLVSHNPDFAEELPSQAVDLVLAGHTHGGQVTFFGLWAPFVPSEYGQKYRTGKVELEGTTVLVSNGVGVIFPPLRFFARPQIVLVTLEKAAD